MKTHFIPIDYDQFDFEGKNYAKLTGRDEKSNQITVIDTCENYLWAILQPGLSQKKKKALIAEVEELEVEKKGRISTVERVEEHKKHFLGEEVEALKIFATNYKDLHALADQLGKEGIEKRRGYDVGFITHYIMESKMLPLSWYEIEGEQITNLEDFGGIGNIDAEKVIMLKKKNLLKKDTFTPDVLAFDIETDGFKLGEHEITMIALVGKDYKKVLTWKPEETKEDYVEIVGDETEMIEQFIKIIKERNPDILTGYFSDGFDLPYLRARAHLLGIKLPLSTDGREPRFSRGQSIVARTTGLVHVDLLKFIRAAYSQYMESESLSLNEVAKEFLGDEKKKITFKHSSKITKEEWDTFHEYNLHDAVLTYQLFEKAWQDMREFSRVIQEPLFEVTRNGMSKNVESYILHNLEKYDEIPEKKPGGEDIGARRNEERFEGAFVLEPKPGLYENIAMFDFTSSYGSVIVTYNLSKSTFHEEPKKEDYTIVAKGKTLAFTKERGFVPDMLHDIIERRKKYKQELKKEDNAITRARSNAFKLLANAYYGYQGFFGARYYKIEAAAATAAFAREAIQKAIKEIDKAGFTTVYSDTDSIAFARNEKSKKETLDFLKEINKKLPGIMELEHEGFFTRGMWVTTRSGTAGAKKKYALLGENGKIKIRGFETVRRDWCKLARETQNKVITLILEDGNEKRALKFLKETIQKVKEGDIEKEKMLIRTQLKKPLNEYKAISPHVIAAKKMKDRERKVSMGGLIEYYIAESREKKALVRDRVRLPEENVPYDKTYYLEKQILPAVENILHVVGINAEELLSKKQQTTLADF